MKAIILAAGLSSRLRPLTNGMPKCMLRVNGKPIIQNAIELFRNNRIDDISIIRGYKKEKINFTGINFFENKRYFENGILHSLLHARPKLEECIDSGEEVIISFSDILFNDDILKKLVRSDNDVSIVVDVDWEANYVDRTEHPIPEADKVIMINSILKKIGQNISLDNIPESNQGEFIGLWKFSPKGISAFLSNFDRLNTNLKNTDPFRSTKEWQKADIYDMLQELGNIGQKINCVKIKGGWKEFDTVQDLERASGEIAAGLN